MVRAMLDIHNFDAQYERAQALVLASSLSPRNKTLILGYRDACLLQQVCGKVRLIRAIPVLIRIAPILGKDYDQATKEDLQRVITILMSRKLSPATIATYKAILKRFMGYVLCPNCFVREPSLS